MEAQPGVVEPESHEGQQEVHLNDKCRLFTSSTIFSIFVCTSEMAFPKCNTKRQMFFQVDDKMAN